MATAESITLTDAELVRFWSKVDKNGPVPPHMPHLGPCWVWTGTKLANGYGKIVIRRGSCLAHRLAFYIGSGAWPTSYACHHCDNRLCVRYASHLFDGTHADNQADASRKGRMASGDKHGSKTRPERVSRGDGHGQSKLTETTVTELRRLHASGMAMKELEERFGVKRHAIQSAIDRITWRHVE